jgi:hypothetical protein
MRTAELMDSSYRDRSSTTRLKVFQSDPRLHIAQRTQLSEPYWRVSFAGYSLPDNANFFYQYMVDAQTMYMPLDGYKRIVWNPSALEITGVMEDTSLQPALGDLTLEAAGNRTGVCYERPTMQPFFYHDED